MNNSSESNNLFSLPQLKETLTIIKDYILHNVSKNPERVIAAAFVIGMLAVWKFPIFIALVILVFCIVHLQSNKSVANDNDPKTDSNHTTENKDSTDMSENANSDQNNSSNIN